MSIPKKMMSMIYLQQEAVKESDHVDCFLSFYTIVLFMMAYRNPVIFGVLGKAMYLFLPES